MRSHFLKDLPITSRESIMKILPDFDFYNVRRITQLSWTSEFDEMSGRFDSDLTLTAAYQTSPPRPATNITIRCSNVMRLVLPELGPAFYLGEIEVEDISKDQIEGVRYKLKDFGESQFEILCGNIDISLVE